MAVDPNLALMTAQEAIKFQRELLAAGVEFAHWIGKLLEEMDKPELYGGNIGELPLGTRLRFWLANVDDEATLRCAGLTVPLRIGEGAVEKFHVLRARGEGAIALHVANSGMFNWRADLHVDAEGIGRIIDHSDGGNDNAWPNRKRLYVWKYNVV